MPLPSSHWPTDPWNLLHEKQNIEQNVRQGWGPLCYSLLYPKCLEQCLVQSWHSVDTREMNACSNFRIVHGTTFLNITVGDMAAWASVYSFVYEIASKMAPSNTHLLVLTSLSGGWPTGPTEYGRSQGVWLLCWFSLSPDHCLRGKPAAMTWEHTNSLWRGKEPRTLANSQQGIESCQQPC